MCACVLCLCVCCDVCTYVYVCVCVLSQDPPFPSRPRPTFGYERTRAFPGVPAWIRRGGKGLMYAQKSLSLFTLNVFPTPTREMPAWPPARGLCKWASAQSFMSFPKSQNKNITSRSHPGCRDSCGQFVYTGHSSSMLAGESGACAESETHKSAPSGRLPRAAVGTDRWVSQPQSCPGGWESDQTAHLHPLTSGASPGEFQFPRPKAFCQHT